MSVTNATPITLSNLLSDPDFCLQVYAIPLLLISFVVTFAGAFLTLDRTRSFPPIDEPTYKAKSSSWRMEGGVGGMKAGWLCGMHLSTYLSLLILNRTSIKLLSGVDFLVIWLLVSIPLAIIGSRWRIAACVFFSVVGSASFTALINIIFLPKSMFPRLVLYAVFTILFLVGTLLPMPIVRHATLRTASALTGSAGMVIAIALFSRVPSWSNPWLTFAIAPYVGPVDSREKGLSAALCVLAASGAAMDWLLKTKLGEDPDKEWDAYLARYSRNSTERVGDFRPLPSLWDRIFKRGSGGTKNKEMIFPPDSQLLPTPVTSSEKERFFTGTPPPSFTPYPPTRKRTALTRKSTRSPKPVDDSDDSSSEDEKDGPPKFRPWSMKRTSTGHTTLVGEMGSLAPPPKLGTTVEEYSDVEQDLSATPKEEDRSSPGWKPAFLRKHEASKAASTGFKPIPLEEPKVTESPKPLSRQTTSVDALPAMPMPKRIPSVPNTPSLIQAYNRINKAQQDALISPPLPSESLSRKQTSLELDDGFWDKVRAKAGE